MKFSECLLVLASQVAVPSSFFEVAAFLNDQFVKDTDRPADKLLSTVADVIEAVNDAGDFLMDGVGSSLIFMTSQALDKVGVSAEPDPSATEFWAALIFASAAVYAIPEFCGNFATKVKKISAKAADITVLPKKDEVLQVKHASAPLVTS